MLLPFPADADPICPLARRLDKPVMSESWRLNGTLTWADFPLHVLHDLLNRDSEIVPTGAQLRFDAPALRPGGLFSPPQCDSVGPKGFESGIR